MQYPALNGWPLYIPQSQRCPAARDLSDGTGQQITASPFGRRWCPLRGSGDIPAAHEAEKTVRQFATLSFYLLHVHTRLKDNNNHYLFTLARELP
jgi:hypothetical protein